MTLATNSVYMYICMGDAIIDLINICYTTDLSIPKDLKIGIVEKDKIFILWLKKEIFIETITAVPIG